MNIEQRILNAEVKSQGNCGETWLLKLQYSIFDI